MTIAIRTLAGLQSAITDWLARADLTVDQVNDCIAGFEAEANRLLRVRQMEASADLTTASGVAGLPSDYLAYRSLTWGGSTTAEIEYVHPMTLRGWYGSDDADTPHWFTIEGDNIIVRPVDDTTTLTLRYWRTITSLIDAGTTNWLLTAHPDVYLKGSLYYALMFLRDSAAGQAKQLMDEGLSQIASLSERSKAPVAMQVYGFVA